MELLLEKKYSKSEQASMLIEAVIKNRRKLSNRRLKNEKYNLIKRIKENYSVNDFFNSRIPNYKVLASIYNVFELESSKEIQIKITRPSLYGERYKLFVISKNTFEDKFTLEDYGITLLKQDDKVVVDNLKWNGEAKKNGFEMGDYISEFKIENSDRPSKIIVLSLIHI